VSQATRLLRRQAFDAQIEAEAEAMEALIEWYGRQVRVEMGAPVQSIQATREREAADAMKRLRAAAMELRRARGMADEAAKGSQR
jgi:hypothetical protein